MAFMAHPLPDSGWCDPSAKRSQPVMRSRSIAIASLHEITANSLSPACPVRCGVGVRGPSDADYASDGCQHWMLVSTGRSRIGQSCRVLTSSWRAPHDVGAEPVYGALNSSSAIPAIPASGIPGMPTGPTSSITIGGAPRLWYAPAPMLVVDTTGLIVAPVAPQLGGTDKAPTRFARPISAAVAMPPRNRNTPIHSNEWTEAAARAATAVSAEPTVSTMRSPMRSRT